MQVLALLFATVSVAAGYSRDPVKSLLSQQGIVIDYESFTPSNGPVSLVDWREPQRFEVPLDHNLSSARNFTLRYWEDQSFFDPKNASAPIFLYLCGEWTCSSSTPSTHSPFLLGRELGADLITLEHRYYGDSQPFTSAEGGWSIDNLKWLTVEQAMADIAAFIRAKNEQYGEGHKWVIIGGSYPGALTAWFKLAYPDLVEVVWSSSGVVKQKRDYPEFDLAMYLNLKDNNQTKCAHAIQNVTNQIQKILDDGSDKQAKEIYDLFALDHVEDESDVMQFVADIFAYRFMFGARDMLCGFLESEFFQTDGILGLSSMKIAFGSYSPHQLRNATIDASQHSRQWTYQVCTELGFFQEANTVFPLRSSDLDGDYFEDFCQRIFPGLKMPTRPANYFEEKFGKPSEMKIEKAFFFASSEDPWKTACFKEDLTSEQKASKMVSTYIECPTCGHCSDLSLFKAKMEPAVKSAVIAAYQKIEEWLAPEGGATGNIGFVN